MVQARGAKELSCVRHADLHRHLPFKHGHHQLDMLEFGAVHPRDLQKQHGVFIILRRLLLPSGKLRQLLLIIQRIDGVAQDLREIQTAPPRRRPTFILKDVRLFLNSLDRSLTLMRSAGVNAGCARQDTEDEILLTIRIPKARRVG